MKGLHNPVKEEHEAAQERARKRAERNASNDPRRVRRIVNLLTGRLRVVPKDS